MKHSCLSVTYTKSAPHLMVITWRSGKLYLHSTLCWEVCRFCSFKPSGHNMYRTVITVCTAQWSQYVPHSGHNMYRQFNIFQFHNLPTQCIYVLYVDLRTNSHCFLIQHYLDGFYNWDGLCLLRGTFYILRSAHAVYLCVLCGSENKQRLFHCTALTGWFL